MQEKSGITTPVVLLGVTAIVFLGVVSYVYGIRTENTNPPTQSSFYTGMVVEDAGVLPTETTTTTKAPARDAGFFETLYGGFSWSAPNESTVSQATETKPTHTAQESDIGALFRALIGATVKDASSDESYMHESMVDGIYYDATTTPSQNTQTESDIQRSLRAYANELGAYISAFQRGAGDEVAILNAFIEDRKNAHKMQALGESYSALAQQVALLDAPVQFAHAHTMLIEGYTQVGQHLIAIAHVQNDEELLDAIYAYNEQPGTVVGALVRITDTLSAFGVEFKDTEPGSMFEFVSPYGK